MMCSVCKYQYFERNDGVLEMGDQPFRNYSFISAIKEIKETFVNGKKINTKLDWVGGEVVDFYLCPKCHTVRAE